MKRHKILNNPTRINEVDFDGLFEDVDDWRLKAERLQARRWRKLKQQLI